MSKYFGWLNAALTLTSPLWGGYVAHHAVIFGAIVTGANAIMHWIAPQLNQGPK